MPYEDIRQALAAKFEQLSSSLDELQSRAREMKHESRAKWESQLADLERQRRAARSRLTEFSSNSAEAWETFKTGMEATWQSLKTACEETGKKLK